MMGAGLGVGMDRHRAGPKLFGSRPRPVDRRRAGHTGRLCRVGIEGVPWNDLDAVGFPVGDGARMRMGVLSQM